MFWSIAVYILLVLIVYLFLKNVKFFVGNKRIDSKIKLVISLIAPLVIILLAMFLFIILICLLILIAVGIVVYLFLRPKKRGGMKRVKIISVR